VTALTEADGPSDGLVDGSLKGMKCLEAAVKGQSSLENNYSQWD